MTDVTVHILTSNIVTRMDDFRGGLADLRRRVDALEQRAG